MSKTTFKHRLLIAILAVVLISGGIALSHAQSNNPTNAPVPPPNPNAVLDHLNIPNPFNWTRDVLGLGFAQNFQGGERAMENWMRNWFDILLPGLKDMTAQWRIAKTDHTRNIGDGINAQNIDEAQLEEEIYEYEAVSGGVSETACQISSGITGGSGSGGGNTGKGGLSSGFQISNAITRAMGEQLAKEGLNTEGSPSEYGPTADYGHRYALYKQYFCDPLMNGGQADCTSPGPLPNGDVSIENFLLKDTIDMSKPEEEQAAYAITRNLVMPNVSNTIPQGNFEGFSGKNSMIKKRELQALRNIPISVVSNIIGRRTAIPDSNVSDTIRPIRERSGIDPSQISDKASFNEIMLALTKERFYDPNYFVTVSESTEEQIAQEQMGVDVLTQITLRQIHLLQEQMNALLAARASIKHNSDSYDNAALKFGGVSGN